MIFKFGKSPATSSEVRNRARVLQLVARTLGVPAPAPIMPVWKKMVRDPALPPSQRK